MFTILHISDLHRSKVEPLDNSSLIASLMADRDRYFSETGLPQAIIISGDIIQGAPLHAKDWAAEVKSQYDVASNFLRQLADRFLGGDRSRIVIVPGNHDVCWNTAIESMEEVKKAAEPDGVPAALFDPTGKHRWSWKHRRAFKIVDEARYQSRLDAYWNFVTNFYAETKLAFALDRNRGFNLFELANGRIVVAAFESVHGNDCYSSQGSLAEGVVARCSLAIRDSHNPYQLRVAVWHHSVQGRPGQFDFMDVQNVHEMIGHGFRLGFHGHQHLADANAHYIHLPEAEMMAVASAGSLCAGARELPRGIDRQYNVVAIDDENWLSARVYAREMAAGNQFGRSSKGPFAATGYLNLSWRNPTDAGGRPIDEIAAHQKADIAAAERALHNGDPARALSHVAMLASAAHPYARSIAIEAARESSDWNFIIATLSPPLHAGELTELCNAFLMRGSFEDAARALEAHAQTLDLAIHIIKSIEDRIVVAREMKGGSK